MKNFNLLLIETWRYRRSRSDLVTSKSGFLMAVIFVGSRNKFWHIFSFCCPVANLSCSQVSLCVPATTVYYTKKRKIVLIFNPLIFLRKKMWIWKAVSQHFGHVWLILSSCFLTAITNLVWTLFWCVVFQLCNYILEAVLYLTALSRPTELEPVHSVLLLPKNVLGVWVALWQLGERKMYSEIMSYRPPQL